MLNSTNHQGNAKQNHASYNLTPVRMAIVKGQGISSARKDVEKREHLRPVGGNVNWCSHCGEQYGGSSKN